MNSKFFISCMMLLLSAITATNAQSNDWEVYTTDNSSISGNSALAVSCGTGSAWVGTTFGASYFNGTQWTVLTSQNSSLPGNQVNDIARETNGTLWFATNNGLAKLYNHDWTVYTMANSILPVDIIKCISIDSHGNKWIGTWGGGLVKFDNANWTVYSTTNSQIPGNGINSVSIDSNDQIWVGTFSNGLGVLNNSIWTIYNTSNSALQSNDIKTVAVDKNDNTWICTGNGIVRISGSNWSAINYSITGFPFEVVNDVVCGDKIWFASDNGVIVFDGTHWTNLQVGNSPLPANDVRAIDIDQHLNVWIATAGGGLAIHNPDGVTLSIENASAASTVEINAFPSPADGEVTLSFNTEESGKAEAAIYDIQGKRVCTILNEEVGPGRHQVKFDSNVLPAGVYIWWVRFKDRIDTMKLPVI